MRNCLFIFILMPYLVFTSCRNPETKEDENNVDYAYLEALESGNSYIESVNTSSETTSEDVAPGTIITVPYTDIGGVVTIPVKLNGTVGLDMIFDTGASVTTITQAEAQYLFQKGVLSQYDILNEIPLTTADGNVSIGLAININNLVIDNQILLENIEVVVVENQRAPLLLGNSVRQHFNKTAIDIKNQVVEFYL